MEGICFTIFEMKLDYNDTTRLLHGWSWTGGNTDITETLVERV